MSLYISHYVPILTSPPSSVSASGMVTNRLLKVLVQSVHPLHQESLRKTVPFPVVDKSMAIVIVVDEPVSALLKIQSSKVRNLSVQFPVSALTNNTPALSV